MKGLIVMWWGTAEQVPFSWHICDGSAGTPDLRNRFLLGVGLTFFVGDTGGADSHIHTFTANTHAHVFPPAPALTGVSPAFNNDLSGAVVTGTSNPADNRPSYYALYFIQKL